VSISYASTKEIEKFMDEPFDSREDAQYQQGRLVAVNDFSVFLKENYHEKLPRRMQKDET
jgi:hypothetical protein